MLNKKNPGTSRRRFLGLGISALGSILGLSYVGLIGDFFNPPPLQARTLQEVGQVTDFPLHQPKLVSYKGAGIDEGVYVINFGPEGWLALDFHCTHLQCAVTWIDATQQFVCPCHGGIYDLKGNVLSGPPPKNLPMRQIKIQGESVFVGG